MRTYFDSSALVAAMVEEENHHSTALTALADATDGFTSSHTLAEVFATLTGGRLDIRLSPNEAARLIEINVIEQLQVLAISVSDYRQVMTSCQEVGARGGAIFDMLHAHMARRGKAQQILTIDVRHFQAFAPDLKGMIASP